MKIMTANKVGNDLYGTVICEHCNSEERLHNGYDDSFWLLKVLPARHCGGCGKNRAGELQTAGVIARNLEQGIRQ